MLYRLPLGYRLIPLYRHTIHLIQPHTLVEAEKYQLQHPTPDTLQTVGERLRWYRYHRGLLQRDVARAVGLSRTSYSKYETGEQAVYPLERLGQLAKILGIDIEHLI